MSKDVTDRSQVVKEGIEQLIALFQAFFRGSNEISIRTRPESKSNPNVWLILLEKEEKGTPLSMLVFFDFDETKAKEACRSLGLFLISFGYEVFLEEDILEPSTEDETIIESMYEFFSSHHSFSTRLVSKNEEEASLIAENDNDSVEFFSLPPDNKTNLMLLEKCMSIFFASKDKTVTLAENTTVNIYGCAAYSEDNE